MTIILKPGDFGDRDLIPREPTFYNRLLPVTMTEGDLLFSRQYMTPDEWYVYTALLWFEHVKLEEPTPTLEAMWEKYFKNFTFERFKEILDSLGKILVGTQSEKGQNFIPLVQIL